MKTRSHDDSELKNYTEEQRTFFLRGFEMAVEDAVASYNLGYSAEDIVTHLEDLHHLVSISSIKSKPK